LRPKQLDYLNIINKLSGAIAMELLYLWINDYECFKNIGFNFGGKYLYSYDREKNSLSIRENEDYIKDFFNDKDKNKAANIQNITAIVGKNASGKTTLIKKLDETFCPTGNSHLHKRTDYYRFVIVMWDSNENRYKVYTRSYTRPESKDNNIEIPEKFKENHKRILENPKEDKNVIPKYNIKQWIENLFLIHYSPVVDGQYDNDDDRGYGNYADISTNYLMFKADRETVAHENADDKKYIDSHIAHIIAENRRIVTFLKSGYADSIFEQLNIWALDALSVKPLHYRYKKSNAETNDEKNKKEPTLIEKLNKVLQDKWNTTVDEDSLINYLDNCKKTEELFKELIKLNFIYSRAQNMHNPDKPSKQRTVKIETGDDLNKILPLPLDNCLLKLDGLLNKLCDTPKSMRRPFERYLEAALFCYKKGMDESQDAQRWIDDTLLPALKEIFTQFHVDNMIRIGFPGYSSGEITMLKFYSRFWDIKDSVNKQPNVMILIDEGELYLHPQWQKELLNRIIEMCNAFFPGKNIQIIFATNNPIMLSDMPTQNIIFLEKDKDQTVSSASINVQQTFASTIAKILADSFFLEGGMIGDFAKKKINEIIEMLDNPTQKIQVIIEKEEYISRTIRLIGEPVIRRHLEQKFHEVISSVKLSTHDNEISSLKERFDSLERQNGEDK